MFDIGWQELVLIAIVALIVVGPKELPKLFKAVGHFMGRARGMAREFQRSMEQAADDSGLKDAADSLKGVDRLNMTSAKKTASSYAKSMMTDPSEAGKPDSGAGTTAAAGPETKTAASPSATPAQAEAGTSSS